MKRSLILLFLAGVLSIGAKAQTITWPAAFDLSTGNYQFNNWPALSPEGTYPANMGFYRLDTTLDPLLANNIYQDYDTAYNLTAGTRLNGLGTAGFSFLNTSTTTFHKLGAAVVAINTTGRTNIQVKWTGTTVTPNLREYEIRLFWRVGNTGAFLPVIDGLGDTVNYVRSATAGDSVVLGPVTLPVGAEGQPLVQVCWKYFMTATNIATGTRAELGVSNVSITSSGSAFPIVTPTPGILPDFAARVGNVSAVQSFSVTGSALTGNITASAVAPFEVSASATGPFSSSIVLTETGGTLAATNVYVRFSPSAAGTFTNNISLTTAGAATQYVSVTGKTFASTNPAAHVMSSGSYSFNQWDSTSAAGTYPANMIFHVSDDINANNTLLPLAGDWTCLYDLTARPRFVGLDTMGIAFINTGSPQYNTCDSLSGTSLNIFTGAAVLALNTVGVANLVLDFNAGLIAQDTSTPARVYDLRLQYRLDSLSTFSEMSPEVYYSSAAKVNGDLEHFNLSLPSSFNNLPYLQLRWLYHAENISGATGTRPELRLDNVNVSGILGIDDLQAEKNGSYPNPVGAGETLHFRTTFSGKVYDATGRELAELNHVSEWNAPQVTGLYILVGKDGQASRFIVR